MARNRPQIKTSVKKIAKYWSSQWGVTLPQTTCWGCLQDLTIHRAHIQARMDGGKDAPDNLILACRSCNAAIDGTYVAYGRDVTLAWIQNAAVNGILALPPVYKNLPNEFKNDSELPAETFVTGYQIFCQWRNITHREYIAPPLDPIWHQAAIIVRELLDAGLTMRAIAAELEARQILTPRGGNVWHAQHVFRLSKIAIDAAG